MAGLARQKTIDDTTVGVQKTLDQMREEASVAREAGRQSPKDRAKERDEQVAAAQAEFDAAVETANSNKAEDRKKPDQLKFQLLQRSQAWRLEGSEGRNRWHQRSKA